MRTLKNIARISAAAASIGALGIALPAFAAGVGGGGFNVGAPAIGGGGPAGGGGAPAGGAPGGGGFNVGAPSGGHFNGAAVGARGPNANFAANPAGRMGHAGHGHFHRGYGGGYYGYGWDYPDYAWDYGSPDDYGYDEGYAGTAGSYCQTPVRSCGISEPAAIGTPCGCQSRTGTVWGQVQ